MVSTTGIASGGGCTIEKGYSGVRTILKPTSSAFRFPALVAVLSCGLWPYARPLRPGVVCSVRTGVWRLASAVRR